MSAKSEREQREKNKCNQNCPFLEHGTNSKVWFLQLSYELFDVKLLINNNIIGNKTFPPGASCGRWYKVIQFAFCQHRFTSAPRLKSRHCMVSTFHDKQSWDSPACSGRILGPLIRGHFAFQSVLQILLLLLPFK